MRCHFVFAALLAAFAGCSSTGPVEGTVLSQSMQALDGGTEEAIKIFVVAPGTTDDLALRVAWTVQAEQSEAAHPFGSVEVAVERNGIAASSLTCSTDDPEFAGLLGGDRVWMMRLSCAYAAEAQQGKDISASLWANGLLTRD